MKRSTGMKKSWIVFWVLGCAIVPAGMIIGGGLIYYVDIPSLVIVPFMGILLTIASHGANELFSAYGTAVRRSKEAGESEVRRSIAVFKSLEANIILSSLFGPLLGIIAMLKNVQDLSVLASGLAIVLLTLMYGVLFILLFSYPFKHHLQAEAAGRM